MMRARPGLIVMVLVLLAIARPAVVRAQSDPPSLAPAQLTDEHIALAIDAIVAELAARRHAERHWEPDVTPAGESTRQRGGYTALVVLAMLHAGISYQDPRLADAIAYLEKLTMEGTYATAVRNNVWAHLPDRFRALLTADTQWLLDAFSDRAGGWDYVSNPKFDRIDNSIRQFGALACWESARRGLPIEKTVWQRIEEELIDAQLDDGGWNYRGDGMATGSMTAAGLATLFITQDLLHAVEDARLESSRPAQYRQAIEKGMAWMDRRFSPTSNPGRDTYFYYYLYGVERVGLASGYARFGGRDWFREGAAELIRRLCHIDPSTGGMTAHATTAGIANASAVRTDDLAFALLFLSRGRVPVAISKLRVDDFAWNNRPRDVANVTKWISQRAERALSWQIVGIEDAPETWLASPLLYLASHKALPWVKSPGGRDVDIRAFAESARAFVARRAAGQESPGAAPPPRPDVQGQSHLLKLKRYLDMGGLLVALGEGSGDAFAESIELAGLWMYPQYEWKDVPDDHAAYTLHEAVSGRKPKLRSLGNGVRDLIILSDGGRDDDLPATFQLNEIKLPAHWLTMANLFFHACEFDRAPPRLAAGHQGLAAADSNVPEGERTRVLVVRAVHHGQWKPEPESLTAFQFWLDDAHDQAIEIRDAALEHIHEIDPAPALVLLSGIDPITLSAAQRTAIRAYVEANGTVLCETVGGRGLFVPSLEDQLAETFNAPVESLLRHAMLTTDSPYDCSRADYRPFSLRVFGARETVSRLRGISINGRLSVIFSRDDLSHALLDRPCWGVSGYTTESARRLMTNMLHHAITPPAALP